MPKRYVSLLCRIMAPCGILVAFLTMGSQIHAVQFKTGLQVGTVAISGINEASGIAASGSNSDVLWVHNDSGDSARVYAMNIDGTHLGAYYLNGAWARDWEDMAVGPGPVVGQSYLYMGDIGDNSAARASIKVYRVAEPVVSSTQSPVNEGLGGVESIELIYPDGARDAETLMVDPLTKDIYVVSKRDSLSRLYRAAYPQSTTEKNTMEYVAQLRWGGATGGDISPDGDEIIVRGYFNASLWTRPSSGDLWDAFDDPGERVSIMTEPQGEAIGFDAAGDGYYTVSEGLYQRIYYFERIWQPGDANRDGYVDVSDLGILATNYGATAGAEWDDADFTGDGKVDVSDLGLLATNYGSGPYVTSSKTVPEPGMLLMLVSALCFLYLNRR